MENKVKSLDIFGERSNREDLLKLTLYHASTEVKPVASIVFPGPRDGCDFGQGFYLTANKQVAEEWVFDKVTPVINSYLCHISKTDILHISGEGWIRVIIAFRTQLIKTFFKSPVICGVIADDRLDESIASFLLGDIGDVRLIRSLDYCNLGVQYCLRTSSQYLFNHSFKELKGMELQRAQQRFLSRRFSMLDGLRKIRREPVIGERFIEDYVDLGDFYE